MSQVFSLCGIFKDLWVDQFIRKINGRLMDAQGSGHMLIWRKVASRLRQQPLGEEGFTCWHRMPTHFGLEIQKKLHRQLIGQWTSYQLPATKQWATSELDIEMTDVLYDTVTIYISSTICRGCVYMAFADGKQFVASLCIVPGCMKVKVLKRVLGWQEAVGTERSSMIPVRVH